jgi:V/A-type H+/Na+-transporting ATPase subunit E
MALQDILEKIREETEEHFKKMAKQFEERKREIEEAHNTKLEEVNADMNERVEENKGKIIKKAENLVEREAKNHLLKEKHMLIEEVLDQAISALCKSEKYESILTDMLKKIDIKDSNAVIISAKGKEEETKKAVKAAEKTFFVSDKTGDFKGGFVVKTDSMEIDNSFENIIKSQLRSLLEIRTHQLLFT